MNLSLALDDWLLPAASKPAERVGPPKVTVPSQVYPLRSGGCVMISAQVRGALPMAYQWLKDGVPLAGATSPTLSLVRLAPSDAGIYRLVARNPEGMEVGPEVQVLVAADGAAANGPEPVRTLKAREVRAFAGVPSVGAPSALPESAAPPAREVREPRQSHPPTLENGALRFEVMDRFDWLCLEGRPGQTQGSIFCLERSRWGHRLISVGCASLGWI